MVRIENLSVAFDGTEVVKNVNLELADGEILGVVGESGSGKSVTALTLMGLVSETAQMTSGRILFDNVVLREAGKEQDKALYRRYQGAEMSMVFQEPMTSLNPTQRVGRQVEEMLRLHTDFPKEKIRERVLETFASVGLRETEKVYESYPHQLSGGMRQRVMIAMAIILHPDLVVADEPTTALDVTVQSQIIELLREINTREQNAMLFITHDLNLARRICHRIAVMKDGRVVEQGKTEDIFRNPGQEYTRKLIEAVPSRLQRRVSVMSGRFPGDVAALSPILQVRDLSVFYREGGNSLLAKQKKRRVVEGAEFDLYRGESLGLVGESGCGKTSLSRAILGMNEDISGSVVHHSVRPQMIFQDPYSSLNPSKTIGWLLQEPLRAAGALDKSLAMTKGDMEAAAYDMLRRVGMEEKYFHRKPSQLSGGQRQRVSIGQALIAGPGLVVADEPVSALDVTIQAQIMELMRGLQQELQLSFLFISHDINVVYQMCDRIMVMKEGRIIEIGETEELFDHPSQDYTKQLLGEF
ncbi:MAG: ABC transporter ATP-binding protein [Roseburia sp.]|nr:ABC transporter ATP-binding protein [Roseburia sp.]MCM1098591.1 ABC transporter ATP-binding protein [Ruminococcus flavefaciens]